MANPTPSTKAKEQQVDPSETKTQFLGNDNNADHGDAAKLKLTSELRHKNQNETTFTLTLQGDPNYCAGKVVALDATFGVFQGNYLLDKCAHRIFREGYKVEIEGHKCLKGHDSGTAPKTPPAKPYSPGSSVPPAPITSVAQASRT
jgi:hypothetical protein